MKLESDGERTVSTKKINSLQSHVASLELEMKLYVASSDKQKEQAKQKLIIVQGIEKENSQNNINKIIEMSSQKEASFEKEKILLQEKITGKCMTSFTSTFCTLFYYTVFLLIVTYIEMHFNVKLRRKNKN